MIIAPAARELRGSDGLMRVQDGIISFAVKDTGIGIPLEKQKLIFEAFQQADGTTSRKYGGTGLGLTISREIARLLGGWMEVKSAPGAGSTFTLFLPQSYSGVEPAQTIDIDIDAHAEQAIDLSPLPENADFNGKKVLVVDDDSRNIFAIDTILEARGMTVIHADNGKIAISKLQEHGDIDLVLMDMMMPEMDGIEATELIRNDPQFQRLPIISLTAKAMKGDRDKAIRAGASGYVTKPVDPEKLLAVMYVWLHAPHITTGPLMHEVRI
jgi:CheY-like chemotaxis protein